MKKLNLWLLFALFVWVPFKAKAGNNFFVNVYGGSTNMWSTSFISLPSIWINAILTDAITDGESETYGGAFRWGLFTIKDNGEKVKTDDGTWYGFKSKDMFSDIQYGLKFGWQPELSPFGIYISCGYQFNKFRAEIESENGSWSKYKIHSLRPGIGIRVTPFINLLEEKGWSPIIEVGTSYNLTLGCNAPYESDKDQFNSGMISTYGIGVRFENISMTLGTELYHYSMFNRDYETVDKIKPYEDIKTNKLTIFLSVSHDF